MEDQELPRFGGDDSTQAVFDYLADLSVERFKYDDEIKTIIHALVDDSGYEVTITAGQGEIILGRAVRGTVLDALLAAQVRASETLQEALDSEEADVENE